MTSQADANSASTTRTDDRSILWSIARQTSDPAFGTGALASIRRGEPEIVIRQAAFHRLVRDVDDRSLSAEGSLRWGAAVQILALLAGGWSPEAPDLGTALAKSDFPESRIGRLLASRGAGFRDQALLTARFLRAKGTACNATDLAELALVESRFEPRAEVLRRDIARSYFRIVDVAQ
jgi:hypothetical protein